MIFKMWVEGKFVLRQPRCHNLFPEIKDKTIYIFEAVIFFKTYCYCQSQEILLKHIFRLYTFGTFYMGKYNYFSGRPR